MRRGLGERKMESTNVEPSTRNGMMHDGVILRCSHRLDVGFVEKVASRRLRLDLSLTMAYHAEYRELVRHLNVLGAVETYSGTVLWKNHNANSLWLGYGSGYCNSGEDPGLMVAIYDARRC